MPKQKTHKATVKRVKQTASGKLFRLKGAKSHLLTNKSKRDRKPIPLSGSDKKKVRKLLPNL